MKQEETPQVIEPIRYKLWQRLHLSHSEIEIIDEALKKQIAQKPDIQGNQAGVYETCSECNWLIIDSEEKPNYCKECGQKLDWGKE